VEVAVNADEDLLLIAAVVWAEIAGVDRELRLGEGDFAREGRQAFGLAEGAC